MSSYHFSFCIGFKNTILSMFAIWQCRVGLLKAETIPTLFTRGINSTRMKQEKIREMLTSAVIASIKKFYFWSKALILLKGEKNLTI